MHCPLISLSSLSEFCVLSGSWLMELLFLPLFSDTSCFCKMSLLCPSLLFFLLVLLLLLFLRTKILLFYIFLHIEKFTIFLSRSDKDSPRILSYLSRILIASPCFFLSKWGYSPFKNTVRWSAWAHDSFVWLLDQDCENPEFCIAQK